MDSASYNYLFTRFGNVLLIFAFFYSLENFLKTPLILKIGQKTLSIYVIHFIIIYGSFTGYGLKKIIGKNLNPTEAIFGAIIFLVSVCLLSFYYAKTNTFLYLNLRKLFNKLKIKA
jgi:peptidoglycan/LPS O-acetylase OafA/YrhL